MTVNNDTMSLSERCYEALLRVSKIIHLDAMTADAIDYDVREFLTDDAADITAELLGVEPNELYEWDRDEFDDVWSWKRPSGWMIEAATPVKSKPSGTGFMFSWGHCWLGRFYGATYDEALEKAFAWAESRPVEP